MPENTITVERVRHELKFRIASVISNTRITPKMARIVLHSPGFEGFQSLAYDDHVKLFFAPENGELVMPVPGPNGPELPEGVERPEGRDYTPRYFDAASNQLTVDFVIHGDGIATRWAERASPGDKVGVGGPRGSFVVKGQADFYLLAGDDTALPAIGRRIEELPEGAKVLAFVEVDSDAERQKFQTASELDLTWITRDPSRPGSRLVEHVEAAALPEGNGYAFIAGESDMSKRLRTHLVEQCGFHPDHVKAAGYWRAGDANFYDGHEH